MKKLHLLAILSVVLLGSACSKSEPKVSVILKEFTITPSASSVSAGKVTFEAKNTGTIKHEMVILKTDSAPGSLATKEGKVDEHGEGIGSIGEIDQFDAGKTQTASFDLKAGSYVLICNIPGHYAGGMHTAFKVT